MSTILPDFPKNPRGTYRIKDYDAGTEAEKLEEAHKLIVRISSIFHVTILVDAKLQGHRWLFLWWPANEPRHLATDAIIISGHGSKYIWQEEDTNGTPQT